MTRKEDADPVKQHDEATRKVTIKVKTTVTLEMTITVTEANKKAACECCSTRASGNDSVTETVN